MSDQNLIHFLFELTHMRHVKHEGWRFLGVPDPESIGEHSCGAAQIAYVLAKMEKLDDPFRAVTMAVFHDIGECRVGDHHKIADQYCECDEEKAVEEQTESLGEMGAEILKLWREMDGRTTPAGNVAKDADLLDQAVMAKKYLDEGKKHAQDWMDNVERHLKTASAKKLMTLLKTSDPHHWWQELKKNFKF